jgi:integrase
MPRPRSGVPAYLRHKPSGRAYVRLPDGAGGRKTVYLGVYDSDDSRREYARLIAALATAPQSPSLATARATGGDGRVVTVNEVMLGFLRHADAHYRRADGTLTGEVEQYRQTFVVLKGMFGRLPAAEFGPLALKALRQRMIEIGWTRKLVNQRVGRVRRMIKWAASEEIVAADVHHGLRTVTGLQAGRTEAAETGPIGPVPEADVRATLPFLPPAVRAMVQVQLLSGMRPGEVCRLRPCDLDTAAAVWVYRPPQHKSLHRGKVRTVALGPKAQAVLAGCAPPEPADYYFCPRRAVAAFHAARSAARKTPRYSSHMARNSTKRVAVPQRPPAKTYTVTSYGQAIRRAVRKVNERRRRMADGGEYERVRAWSPLQLRHTHGTAVRHRYGLEAAQVALGHERADVTQVYAEKNLALAVKVAAEMG